jgi:protein TonB
MKPEMILQADVLDILFEHRNKEYGAYALRREYNGRLMRALGSMLFMLLAGVGFLYWSGSKPPKQYIPPVSGNDTIITVLEPPPPPPDQPPPPKVPSVPARTIDFRTPKIVPDHTPADTIATLDDISDAIISNETIVAPPSLPGILPPTTPPGSGGGTSPVNDAPEVPEIADRADVMPEFPGGMAAWQRFLAKNIRVPGSEEGGPKRVVIRFIVNEDGTLSGLQMMASGGKELDDEIMRVLGKSPKWIPGSTGGKKIKVYHKQPIIIEYEAD